MQAVIEVKVIDLFILLILSIVLLLILGALCYVAIRDYEEWRQYRCRAPHYKRKGIFDNDKWTNL